MLMNGVTRSTRAAEIALGNSIEVVVVEDNPYVDYSKLPTVGDRLP
jgi:hypothetical protein